MYELIQRQVLGSSAATITFNSIPQTYTDLVLLTSFRSSSTNPEDSYIQFNGDTGSNYSFRRLYGNGSGVASDSVSNTATAARISRVNGSSYTANTFTNDLVYITNYTANSAKDISVDTVEENNATGAHQMIYSSRWNGTAAITSFTINILSGVNFAAGSSATLYGVNRSLAFGRPKAVGGNITYSGGYWYHTFTGSSTFATFSPLNIEALVVGGGGGGGRGEVQTGFNAGGGGGGAGGFLTQATSLAPGGYAVIVGSGGAGGAASTNGTSGSGSAFLSLTAFGGGGGGENSTAGGSGGSGGGGGGINGGAGGLGVSGQGNNGGNGGTSNSASAAGGGGAGAAAANVSGGPTAGGAGLPWLNGSFYAGGGGGAGYMTSAAGGVGGGGAGGLNTATAPSGTTNTGGGGGGAGIDASAFSGAAGAGGSGVVIVRYRAD